MTDVLSVTGLLDNTTLLGGSIVLSVLVTFITLFVTGRLPTPTERVNWQTTNRDWQTQLIRKDEELKEARDYIKELTNDILHQQEGIQNANRTLASLVQELPVLIYTVQELVREKGK